VTAAERWTAALAAWAIPENILAAAPESPWGFAVESFAAQAEHALSEPATPTLRCVAEALPNGGALLDVGAGGGAASLPAARGAGKLIAVDQSAAMLDVFASLAARAAPDAEVELVEGVWPAVSVVTADVAVCANVAYNAPDLNVFVRALDAVTRGRVVLELTAEHPQAWLAPLWRHFWDVDRPSEPTAQDAIAVVAEIHGRGGREIEWESWSRDSSPLGLDPEARITQVRRRLCLPASADAEVERLLAVHAPASFEMVTAWWPPSA
jgi:SAM-dependent methyltransferase